MLEIHFISDPICPWCFIAKRRLDQALADLTQPVLVRWEPFQLEPNLPDQGGDFLARAQAVYGGMADHDRRIAQLIALGAPLGIAFNREAWRWLPQTMAAHRLLAWAGNEQPRRQHVLADAIFQARFVEAHDIGDPGVLDQIAVACLGWRAGHAVERLASADARLETQAAIRSIHAANVPGVPCIVINQRAVTGAQPASAYRAMIEEAQAKL